MLLALPQTRHSSRTLKEQMLVHACWMFFPPPASAPWHPKHRTFEEASAGSNLGVSRFTAVPGKALVRIGSGKDFIPGHLAMGLQQSQHEP